MTFYEVEALAQFDSSFESAGMFIHIGDAFKAYDGLVLSNGGQLNETDFLKVLWCCEAAADCYNGTIVRIVRHDVK